MWEFISEYSLQIGILIYLLLIGIMLITDAFYRTIRNGRPIFQPVTFNILGSLTLLFGIYLIWKGSTLDSFQFELLSVGIAIFAIGIALFAWGISTSSYIISEDSRDRMKVIGGGDIQGSVITLLGVRRRYFDDYERYYGEHMRLKDVERRLKERKKPSTKYKAKKAEIEAGLKVLTEKLKKVTVWATWVQYRGILKAIKYKEHLDDEDKNDILKSHEILIRNIMKRIHVKHFLLKKHVNQLLMGIEELTKQLDDLKTKKKDYETVYTELFEPYLYEREEGVSFLTWITENKFPDKEEDQLYEYPKNSS